MKYSEYQVWFHAFNNAVLSFSRNTELYVEQITRDAEYVANFCLEKFKEVENDKEPNISNLTNDLKGIVEQVAQEAIKGNAKKKS